MNQNDTAREVLLQVSDLRVSFPSFDKALPPIQAVRGLSFSLCRGEVLGIVGESGSGKSVSTTAIPGLLPSHAEVSGSILFEGTELVGRPPSFLRGYRGTKIGMIFQEPGRSQDPLQRIGDVFFETLRASNPHITKEAAYEQAAALLEETGLAGARDRLSSFPHQFSGGQLQRVGIALALAQNCSLLIADEPTTALDVTIQSQIISLLKSLQKKRGISILFISHDIDVVSAVSDRIMVMYAGLAMETGKTENILRFPRHPYTQALLNSAPAFGSHYADKRLVSIPGLVCNPRYPPRGCPFSERCAYRRPACDEAIPALDEQADGSTRCLFSAEIAHTQKENR